MRATALAGSRKRIHGRDGEGGRTQGSEGAWVSVWMHGRDAARTGSDRREKTAMIAKSPSRRQIA